jgi:hypothetical protein
MDFSAAGTEESLEIAPFAGFLATVRDISAVSPQFKEFR